MAKNTYTKEQNKERRNINQFKKKEQRERGETPKRNDYRRKKQRDREESYCEDYDI